MSLGFGRDRDAHLAIAHAKAAVLGENRLVLEFGQEVICRSFQAAAAAAGGVRLAVLCLRALCVQLQDLAGLR